MDKFPKLKKTVYIDKPEFHLADPNNPVKYQLRPQKMSPSEVLQSQDNQIQNKNADKYSLDSPDYINNLMKLANPNSVLREGEIPDIQKSLEGYEQIDNPDDVALNINDILSMDVDDSLNELDNLDKYDMTDNDRSVVFNEVYDLLKKQGRISDSK